MFIKIIKTLSNETKQTNKNEHVDGVTNSVQRRRFLEQMNYLKPYLTATKKTDLSILGNEVAEFFYDLCNRSNLIEGCFDIKGWEIFIDKFFEKVKKEPDEIFKTKDDLEKVLVSLDLSRIRTISGIEFGNQFAKPRGLLVFYCSVIFNHSEPPNIFPPIEYTIFKSIVNLADHFRYFGFSKVQFEGEFRFNSSLTRKKFSSPSEAVKKSLSFLECTFHKNQDFQNLFESSESIYFSGSTFKEDVIFSYSKPSNLINFDKVKFEKNAYFQELRFSDPSIESCFDEGSEKTLTNKMSFENSIFKGSAFFTQEKGNNSSVEINLAGAIFEAPVVFDLKFLKCPDFSKASFLSHLKIEETWQIDKEKIDKNDEPKFRFLKKYFAEQGNHFKEQQYFGYEMMAREKKLSIEGGADLFLFKCYKYLSDFGMSVALPFAWLCISFSVFFDIFLWLGCDIESSFSNSFTRTIMPLMKFDIGCVDSNAILALQSLINVTLIFLLGLGIRNKFKIK